VKSFAPLSITACGIILAAGLGVRADNWPSWRGPDENGISKETNLPSTWSATKNILWKAPLPGQGGSTPAIWGDRIFLTSAEGNSFLLMCLNTDGKHLWKKLVGNQGRTKIQNGEGNDASASPSTDGKHVWCAVGTGDVACFDFEGKEIWKFNVQKRYGKLQIMHSWHNTPLLHGDRLYLSLLTNGGHWVVALDKSTGQEVWKVERPTDAKGESREAYSSPILWTTAKDTTLVILGNDYTTGHSLKDGKELWRLCDLNPIKGYSTAFRIIATPVASPEVLVVPTCRLGIIVGLKPDLSGTINKDGPFERWRNAKGAPDVASPLIHNGLVYLPQDGGGGGGRLLLCLDAMTGKELYKVDIHNDRYRASPIYADGKIYLLSRDGTATVFPAGPKFQNPIVNTLDDNFTASPAVSNGRIYLRGFKDLYAIGEKK
jgi:outer membrane protein assembly factor BamB